MPEWTNKRYIVAVYHRAGAKIFGSSWVVYADAMARARRVARLMHAGYMGVRDRDVMAWSATLTNRQCPLQEGGEAVKLEATWERAAS